MDLEEALAQADTYSVDEEICTIDNDLRTITIPSGLQTVGVESDEDVRRLNFQMPKQYHEIDLSEFNIRINFLNANNSGDVYAVTDKAVSGDNITFSWLVGRNALAYRGSIRFIVCLKKTDAEGVVQQEFNTTIAQLTVLEGLETTEAVVAENPDIIEQILARLDELEENGGGGGTPGKDGREIELQNSGTAIQWRYVGDNAWTDLVQLSELKGDPGDDGITPNIQIGEVTTLEPGQQATASITGSKENPLLNLGIPKGQDGAGGGSTEKEWELLKEITLEEDTAYINEKLDGEYKSIILLFENILSSNQDSIGTSIAFNGKLTSTRSASTSSRKFVQNNVNFKSTGFFEAKCLPDGSCVVFSAGQNSSGNRGTGGNDVSHMTKEQMNYKNYIDEVSFSVEGYATNQMVAGASIKIYGR